MTKQILEIVVENDDDADWDMELFKEFINNSLKEATKLFEGYHSKCISVKDVTVE